MAHLIASGTRKGRFNWKPVTKEKTTGLINRPMAHVNSGQSCARHSKARALHQPAQPGLTEAWRSGWFQADQKCEAKHLGKPFGQGQMSRQLFRKLPNLVHHIDQLVAWPTAQFPNFWANILWPKGTWIEDPQVVEERSKFLGTSYRPFSSNLSNPPTWFSFSN